MTPQRRHRLRVRPLRLQPHQLARFRVLHPTARPGSRATQRDQRLRPRRLPRATILYLRRQRVVTMTSAIPAALTGQGPAPHGTLPSWAAPCAPSASAATHRPRAKSTALHSHMARDRNIRDGYYIRTAAAARPPSPQNPPLRRHPSQAQSAAATSAAAASAATVPPPPRSTPPHRRNHHDGNPGHLPRRGCYGLIISVPPSSFSALENRRR